MAEFNGLSYVMNNLYKEIEAMKDRTLVGMIAGARIIQHDMDRTPPLMPEFYGNLRRSFYIVTSRNKVVQGEGARFVPEELTTGYPSPSGIKKQAKLRQDHFSTIFSKALEAQARGAAVGPTVIFGFSAYYAFFVHEDVRGLAGMKMASLVRAVKKGGFPIDPGWTRLGSGPFFFAASIKRNKDKVLSTIAAHAKITMSITQRHW